MSRTQQFLTLTTALAFLIAATPAAAATQVSLENSSQTSAQIAAGQTNTFTASIGGADTDQTVLVDLEVKDSTGTKIYQNFFDNQMIPSGTTKDFSITTPANLANGPYAFSVGIFNPGWNGLQQWYEGAQKFVVGSGTISGTPHNVIAPDTCCFQVTPGFNVSQGQPVTDTITLTNTDSVAHTILVDMEVHPNIGPDQKMDQKFWDNQTFAPGETKTYVMTTQTGSYPPNQYSFALGIFNPGWSSLVDWWRGLGGFQVH